MQKLVETKKSNEFSNSIVLFFAQTFISYIAYLFLVAVVVTSLVAFFFLYTSIFQNNPSSISQVSTASENLWHLDLPGVMKGVVLSGFIFMIFGEILKIILKKTGRKVIKVSTKKKIIISLAVIFAIHLPAIISVSFNNSVKVEDKTSFYVFLTILMIVSVVSVVFYLLLSKLAEMIGARRVKISES